MSIGSEVLPPYGPRDILPIATRLQYAALSPPPQCWQDSQSAIMGAALRGNTNLWLLLTNGLSLFPLAIPQLQQHIQ